MPKSEDRRAEIVDRLADFVLAEGLAAASLRPLAKAAGLSDRMLLYYFRDKSDVIAATLGRISERLVGLLEARRSPHRLPPDALRAELATSLFAPEMWPYMQVWLEMASLAARGDALYRSVGEALGRGFLAWGAAQIDSATPEADAARLLATIEGMVLLKSIGLDDVARRAV